MGRWWPNARYEVDSVQIQTWKKSLLEGAADTFPALSTETRTRAEMGTPSSLSGSTRRSAISRWREVFCGRSSANKPGAVAGDGRTSAPGPAEADRPAIRGLQLSTGGLRGPVGQQPGHETYPYLLRGMEITSSDRVWEADVTCIPKAKWSLYLVAIMDWYSRCVVAWPLLGTDFCAEVLKEELVQGNPEVFKAGQGSQCTGEVFIGLLE